MDIEGHGELVGAVAKELLEGFGVHPGLYGADGEGISESVDCEGRDSGF